MQWQAILMRLSDEIVVEDVLRHWPPPSLGSLESVRSQFTAAFPDGQHEHFQTRVEVNGGWAEFMYIPADENGDQIHSIQVNTNGDASMIPTMQAVSAAMNCKMLDLQTGEYADFAGRTEASMREFLVLCRQMRRERAWAIGVAAVAILTLHLVQDVQLIPAVDRLSKPATFGYGLIGLISLNFLAFFCSVIVGLRDAKHLSSEAESADERDRLEEAILVPTFQGEGNPPSFLAHYLHIGGGVLLGVMAGSVIAFLVSFLIAAL